MTDTPGADSRLPFAESRPLDETRIDGQAVFHGTFLEVHRDRVRLPDGAEGSREFIRHPGASMVVPLLDDGRVLVLRQFRYPVGRVFVEFPAGKIDAGETPRQTAARELVEETGWHAGELAHLTTIHNAIGYSDERIEIFVARALVSQAQRLDVEEFVEIDAVAIDWLVQEVLAGRITDAKTQIGVFWLERLVSGRAPWPVFEAS